ncbi:MAG: hypothetical protein U9P10_10280 [Thermodesulfobacteriota bacterium]|nr:hypothetical protein [Thermodesulfobacteriota bacterium]
MHSPHRIKNKLGMDRFFISYTTLILSLLIVMSSTAYGGAFLDGSGNAIDSSITIDDKTFKVYDRSRSDVDQTDENFDPNSELLTPQT